MLRDKPVKVNTFKKKRRKKATWKSDSIKKDFRTVRDGNSDEAYKEVVSSFRCEMWTSHRYHFGRIQISVSLQAVGSSMLVLAEWLCQCDGRFRGEHFGVCVCGVFVPLCAHWIWAFLFAVFFIASDFEIFLCFVRVKSEDKWKILFFSLHFVKENWISRV